MFSLAGKIPEVKDKLIICRSDSQVKPKVFLMIDIGRLSRPGLSFALFNAFNNFIELIHIAQDQNFEGMKTSPVSDIY